MTDERPNRSVPQELESALRAGLRAVAVARKDGLTEGIDDVEAILDQYESHLEGKSDQSSDPDNLARRVAACRMELEKLRVGDVDRREVVGRIRLMLLPQSRDSTSS